MMGDLIPQRMDAKVMFMQERDHRIYCAEHKPEPSYEIEVSKDANCWKCLRLVPTKPKEQKKREAIAELSFGALVAHFRDLGVARNVAFPIDTEGLE